MNNSMKANKQKVAIAMARACINRNELQELAGVGMSQVKAMISGKNVKPSTFGKICKALGVDVMELLETESEV